MRQTLKKLNTRIASMLMAILLLVCMMPIVSAAEGTCGENLSWTLENGTLTITGTGAMYDYNSSVRAPWYEMREDILWLSLPEGLTHVGDKAFFDCMNLMSVRLPSTVTSVGEASFCQCSGMTMLSLNEGLTFIGKSAFEQCEGLYDLRLPQTLVGIENHAFYRCAGLRYIEVPSGVTYMGSGVFAYCDSLLKADIQAQLDSLPAWTFYGCEQLNQITLPGTVKHSEENAFEHCENLSVVDYEGATREEAKALRSEIAEDVPKFSTTGYVNVSGTSVAGAAQSVTSKSTEDSAVLTTTTVTATQNVTMTTSKDREITTAGLATLPSAQVEASVKNDDGWNELLAEILRAMNEMEAQKKKNETVSVEVKASVSGDTTGIPKDVLNTLSGSKVELTVENEAGGKYVLDCENVQVNEQETGKKDKNKNNQSIAENNKAVTSGFTYTIAAMKDVPDEFDGATAYQLFFHGEENINAEVLIRLPGLHNYQKAYLYQRGDNGLERLQIVIVDAQGYAHFYLARVDNETEYLIGINVPQKETAAASGTTGGQTTSANDAIIPKSLYSNYGVTERTEPVQYVITGRTSSWGMNVNQVTWILVGSMFVLVTVVGVTMFLLNKRKLKMGYIPDLGDEDEED